ASNPQTPNVPPGTQEGPDGLSGTPEHDARGSPDLSSLTGSEPLGAGLRGRMQASDNAIKAPRQRRIGGEELAGRLVRSPWPEGRWGPGRAGIPIVAWHDRGVPTRHLWGEQEEGSRVARRAPCWIPP